MESHAYKRNILLILDLVGTCTSIGDRILMPVCICYSSSLFYDANHYIVFLLNLMVLGCHLWTMVLWFL
jgi:hypothetical protein